jgi:taurine dioxygenase
MTGAMTRARPAPTEPAAVANMTMSSPDTGLEFRRLDGPFGVEVRGVRWGAPDAAVVEELTRALRRHLLLVFRGQVSPTREQSDAFFRGFGPLVLDTEDGKFHYGKFSRDQTKEVHRRDDGNYLVAKDTGAMELGWHNDQSHKPQYKVISQLEAIEFEDGAVPTAFRDMYTVCELLPREVRAKLEGKQGVFLDPRLPGPDELPRLCDAMHPILSAHPDSGRRAVFGSDWTLHRIAGVSAEESTKLIEYLRAFAERNAPYYEHHWRAGDICVWDNFGVQHRRDHMPPGKVRVMRVFEGVAEGGA